MATEEAKELIQKYVEEVWTKGDINAIEDLTTPGFIYHLGGQPSRDKTKMGQFIKMVHFAFPDWKVKILDIFAEGDKVAIRWNCQATHKGIFRGIPPTGNKINFSGQNIYAIENDKIAQEWEHMDSLSMLQQLGVLPNIEESTNTTKE